MMILFDQILYSQDMQQEIISPIKSPNDQRQYKAVILSNHLKLLFIHDSKAQKAACSISVGVGSLKDGERSLGLAHFLEHMLFMGSRKFPKHNQYSEFISMNSGMDNAWTSDQQTNYYFEIINSKFYEGVERICDFFVQALLTETCVQKQRQAVHEQCQLRCGEDNSRKWQILKQFASGPYHNHSIGNNVTLSHDLIVPDLKAFYQNEYSANRINACLISSYSIEQMQKSLLPYFLEIKNKNLPKIEFDLHFLPTGLNKQVKLQSIKDQSIMEFFWVIDSVRPFSKWHPGKYICHILGHQGKNSLLSILKQKQYASSISSYSHDMPKQTIIGLEIQLTEEGEQHFADIYNLVIDYCCWLKPIKHIYEEIKASAEVGFKFKQKGQNGHYVTDLSSSMHYYPLESIINHYAVYSDYSEDVINKFIKQLNPFNLILFYSNNQQLKNPEIEQYLGGKFLISNLPQRKKYNHTFVELVNNPFLPVQIDVLQKGTNKVQKIGNIYFSRSQFQVCKGGIQLIVNSAQTSTFLQTYSQFLKLLLKEITYEAESLKLQIEYNCEDQLSIAIFGFSDTVRKLLKVIAPLLTKIHNSKEAESLFDLNQETLIQDYQNFYFGEVDEITEIELSNLIDNDGTSIEKALEQLTSYKYKGFCKRVDTFWKNAAFQWVIIGNFDQSYLNEVNSIQQMLKSKGSKAKTSNLCTLKLENNINYMKRLTSDDINTSGCIKYHQVGQYSEGLNYLLKILVNYIKEPFFDKLRTQKQLAYYLRAYSGNSRGVLSLKFILISSSTDPRSISTHINEFCANFLQNALTDLTQQKFETIKNSVRSKTLEPHNNLYEYFSFVCRQIQQKTFFFDRKTTQNLEKYLSGISIKDVIDLLRNSLQKCLQIWILSKNHEAQFDKIQQPFKAFDQIKKNLAYYPPLGLK